MCNKANFEKKKRIIQFFQCLFGYKKEQQKKTKKEETKQVLKRQNHVVFF